MCKRLALFISAISSIASLGVQAADADEGAVDFSLSGQAVYTQIKASGERFSPALFQVKANIEFNELKIRGIGLQGVVGMAMSDDSANGMTLDVPQQSAIYVTLTDPNTQPEDLKISILLGYASTKIDTELPNLGAAGKTSDSFSDFSYGFSLQDQIVVGSQFYWSLDLVRYYKDDDLRVDGLGFGVTYVF